MTLQVHPNIASLIPYSPGKPLAELERELGISNAIKLASNENPLGPSPKAQAVLTQHAGELHRYPGRRRAVFTEGSGRAMEGGVRSDCRWERIGRSY